MYKKQDFNYRFLGIQSIIIALTVILLCSLTASAQSGRRTPPLPSNTPAAPTPEPTPDTSSTQPKPVKAQYNLRVVSNIPQSIYMEFTYPERMHTWAIDRLKTSSLLDVESGGTANRKEAIQLAKESTDTYIILLDMDENNFSTGTSPVIKANQGDIWITFYVFSPGTGKLTSTGRAVLQPEGRTGGVLGQSRRRACYPDVFGVDYLLLGASLEAAERVMSSFNIPIPALCR